MATENQEDDRRIETIVDACDTCRSPSVSTDCPLWCSHKKCLIYVDIINNRVCVYYPPTRDGTGLIVADGRSDHMIMSQRIGFAVPVLRSCGVSCLFLLVGLDDSLLEVNFTEKLILRTVAVTRDPSQPVMPTESGRLCVGSCSSDGTLFCGYVTSKGQDACKGRMYYLSIFGELTSAIRSESFMVPTGFAWLGYDKLFFSDGGSNKIYGCRLQEKNGVKNFTARKVVFKLPVDSVALGHRLGGIAIDAEEKLWVALTGASCIIRIDPITGLELYRLAVPMKNPTSCVFGGYELCDLYVTFDCAEGVMHEGCSVDDGAVFVLKGNDSWGVQCFRGAQGATMADLPEKEVLRACTPVRETETGIFHYFTCSPVLFHLICQSPSTNADVDDNRFSPDGTLSPICLSRSDSGIVAGRDETSSLEASSVTEDDCKMPAATFCDIFMPVLDDVMLPFAKENEKPKSFAFDENEEKYIVFGGGYTPTV